MTKQPRDDGNEAIPVLGYRSGGAQHINITSSSRSAAFADSTRVISIYATEACYIALGNAAISASASDHFIPADTYLDISLGSDIDSRKLHKYLAISGTGGIIHISERI